VLRRTHLAFTGAVTTAHLEEIATALATEWGWDDARTRAEVTAAATELRQRHGGVREQSASSGSPAR